MTNETDQFLESVGSSEKSSRMTGVAISDEVVLETPTSTCTTGTITP